MAGKLTKFYVMLVGAVVCGVARPLVIFLHFHSADRIYMIPSASLGAFVGLVIGAQAVTQIRMSQAMLSGAAYSLAAFACVAIGIGSLFAFVASIFAFPITLGEVATMVLFTWTYVLGMCVAGALTGCVCFLFVNKINSSRDFAAGRLEAPQEMEAIK